MLVSVPFGGESDLCYGLHVLCCDEYGVGEDVVEGAAVVLIRRILAGHAVGLYVG